MVGQYKVNSWVVRRDDDKGSKWELEASGGDSKGLFDIKENQEHALEIGEPVVSILNASYREGSYSFSQQLKGKNGENINLTRNGSTPSAPQLNIKNKEGTYDRTYAFSYG